MTTDLKSMVRFASAQVEKMFRRNGEILAMYHAIRSNAEHMVLPPPSADKDISVALMKAAFAVADVDRYVFMVEAWRVEWKEDGGAPPPRWQEGIHDHPDRREIVLFSAENRRGEMLTAHRYILRPEHGKPVLAPLAFDDHDYAKSSGRMIGLLNQRSH
jgi:hypothetical protein